MKTPTFFSAQNLSKVVKKGHAAAPTADGLRPSVSSLVATSLMSLALLGCQSVEPGAPDMTYGWGAAPLLKPPEPQTVPVMKLSKAVGWKPGETPIPAEGFEVQAFAQGLDHPRWLYELPNGDILVAETDAPQASSGRGGVLSWFAKRVMRFTGSGYPSADRITLLRDTDQDGVADLQVPFIENLRSPFGMALVGGTFYVANTDAVLAFPYEQGQTRISAPGELVANLPANAPNSHWTKNLLAHPNGASLFVAIGSNSNIGELGPDAEQGRAGIWRLDLATRDLVPFAKGLRNPVGMDWHSPTDTLWTVVNERDQLGNDLVPDYLAQVNEGTTSAGRLIIGASCRIRVCRGTGAHNLAQIEKELSAKLQQRDQDPIKKILKARQCGLDASQTTHSAPTPHHSGSLSIRIPPFQVLNTRHHYAAWLLEP